MKEIKAYETVDGELFHDKNEALKHEIYTNFEENLTELCDHTKYSDKEIQIIIDFISSNKVKLHRIIRDLFDSISLHE